MRRLVLDANALISLFDGEDIELQEALANTDELIIPVIAYAEVYAGTENEHRRSRETQKALTGLISMPLTRLHPCAQPTALLYSRIYNHLKSIGRMIPTNDIWIAASTLELNGILFTRDRHFVGIPELTVRGL